MEDYLKTALAHCRNEILVLNGEIEFLRDVVSRQAELIEQQNQKIEDLKTWIK